MSPTKHPLLLLLLLCVGHHSTVFGYHGDGSVSQDDVIRFVLSMQSKEGATASNGGRMRYYQQLPDFKFADGKQPNDVNDDQNIDKALYNLGF